MLASLALTARTKANKFRAIVRVLEQTTTTDVYAKLPTHSRKTFDLCVQTGQLDRLRTLIEDNKDEILEAWGVRKLRLEASRIGILRYGSKLKRELIVEIRKAREDERTD